MRPKKNNLLEIGLGWTITIVVIFAIPIVAIDSVDRSSFFWHRVLWTAFLATIVWSIGGAFISRATYQGAEKQRSAGVMPALTLISSGYAVASFVVMMLSVSLADGDSPSKTHLIVQILLASFAAVFYALLLIPRRSASSGLESLPESIPEPSELVTQIEIQEKRLRDMGADASLIVTELKQLREVIKYSLPRVGGIASNAGYHAFTHKVVYMCINLSQLSSVSAEASSACMGVIRSLQLEVRSIAGALKC